MTLPISPNAGLHVRYEKAGLILDALPIPWNADAVIVEANVRLPAKTQCDKRDFVLKMSAAGHEAGAELIAQQDRLQPARVYFRLPAPAQTCTAEVRWRDHSLGVVELPVLSRTDFDAGLIFELPTLQVTLGSQVVACQSFVSGQAKSVCASAVLRSRTPLAPIIDQDLRVEVQRETGESVGTARVPFVADQLRSRQTLVTALLPRLRGVDCYGVAWHLGSRCLHTQSLKVVSKKTFERSLRISATRFIIERDDGPIQTLRSMPTRDGKLLLDGIRTVVPCFFVSSGEAGMAGQTAVTLRALVDGVVTTLGRDDAALVTDGPTPIILGAAPAADLHRIKHFTLAVGERVLGNLPLLPVPQADIDAEGGFAPLDDFLWSPAAQEQLDQRLGKLLDGS